MGLGRNRLLTTSGGKDHKVASRNIGKKDASKQGEWTCRHK